MRHTVHAVFLAAILAFVLPEDAQAQLPLSTPAATAINSETPAATTLDQKRNDLAERLRLAQRSLDVAKDTVRDGAPAPPPERLTREVELLKQLDIIIAQQQTEVANGKELATRQADVTGQLETVLAQGPQEKPPYSFLMVDKLREEVATLEKRTSSVDDAVNAAHDNVAKANVAAEAKQVAWTQAKEAAAQNKDELKAAELASAVKVAELEAKLATETLELRKRELANQQLSQTIHLKSIELGRAKLDWMEKQVQFSEQDLEIQLAELERQEAEIKRSAEAAQANLEYVEQQWFEARQRLDQTTAPPQSLKEEVEAKRLDWQMRQQQISVINYRLQIVSTLREVWNRRFKAINQTATPEEILDWRTETQARLGQLNRDRINILASIEEQRQNLANLDNKLQAVSADDGNTARWIRAQQVALQKLTQSYDLQVVAVDVSITLHNKLLAELTGTARGFSPGAWWGLTKAYIKKIWNAPITQIGDKNILTGGKVVTALAFLLAGLFLSRRLSQFVVGRVTRRMRVNESASHAIQSLLTYVLIVAFFGMGLRTANVPLTAFAFLGGAIAIGVGFGSQNIVNNFISGLILLAERPIRVGDLIQVDNLYGTVDNIGARSTKIRTGENLEIIVPNSTFLESNVFNLTLSSERLRTKVIVGLAYGSPTREAERLLIQAATNHNGVQKDIAPFVIFQDFGDNSLVFELHFWVRVRTSMARLRIESDIRYEIDRLFREAGITIAFPQRDIHFDAKPLQVRLLPDSGNTKSGTQHAA